MESLGSRLGGLWQSMKNSLRDSGKERIEITLDEMGELEAAMSSSEFLRMEKKEAGAWLFDKGEVHLRNHYDTEGGNPVELDLAMSFFCESGKLGNPDAERNLGIQRNVELAMDCYNNGLKYWDGFDGGDIDKDKAKRYMKQACDLGLFAAADWCKKNLNESYPLVVKLGEW